MVSPLYEENKEFLNEQGFVVEHISHGVYVLDKKEPWGELADFANGGCALIIDTNSPKIDLINKLFGKEQSRFVESWTEEKKKVVTSNDILSCTGYEGNWQPSAVLLSVSQTSVWEQRCLLLNLSRTETSCRP